MTKSLLEFFPYNRKNLVDAFMVKLKEVLVYFEKQQAWRFYSSSLLFLYDANDKSATPVVSIKMVSFSLSKIKNQIDFAHAFRIEDGGRDAGYLFGLKNLIKHMEEVRNM
jgi:hypothetical protein